MMKHIETEGSEKQQKTLPFYNLSLQKQIDVLRGYAILHEKTNNPVSYKEVSSVAKTSAPNASSSSGFWVSINLLDSHEHGKYIPLETASQFNKQLEWGEEEAAWQLMGSHVRNAWFTEHLNMSFKLQATMTNEELINSLGSAADLPKKDAKVVKSLKHLIEFLELCKIIKRDDKGDYSFNVEMKTAKKIEVPTDKDMIQILIGKDRFAVEVKELEDFVREHGKKISAKDYRIE